MNAEVVVTGIGLVTPLAQGREENWKHIRAGIPVVQGSLPDDLPPELVCFARSAPVVQRNGAPRVLELASVALEEALKDSGLDLDSLGPERIGCSVSVSKPILSRSAPFSVLLPESVGRTLSKCLKITGPVQNCIAACATGIHSIEAAVRWIRLGLCDAVIAGSAESSMHPLYVSGFKQMGVLSGNPRPFDRRRKGFVIGEGAGILVLERKDRALERGAFIYGSVADVSTGADTSHPIQFSDDGSSIAAVLKKMCRASGIPDYVNLHGTGTRSNDVSETRAVRKVFGAEADRVSFSSTKASTGHLLGAAGSVEAAIALLAMRDGFIPPTLGLEEPDPECGLDYTPQKGRVKKIESAASLSFGFGGAIGAVCFQKCP